MRQLFNSGVTPAQVQANPGLVPLDPFVQNMFPGYQDFWFPGSASANYYYGIYGIFGGPSPNGAGGYGSDLDNLNLLDRVGSPNNCITITGCWTFFAPQGSAMPTWTNAGKANYHSLIVTLRRALSSGFAFDFNYTVAHAIDNGSVAADGTSQFGGVLQNAFQPNEFRGSSDFDIRHQVNANFLYQLPFGKGKRFLSAANRLVDEIVGGWEVSSLMRFQTGTPSTISGDGVYPTNYWQAALAIPWGSTKPRTGTCTDSSGVPNLFCVANPTSFYQDEFPGQTGTRAIIRLPGSENIDVAVAKAFRLPWEGHFLTFRTEAFNLFNHVNFNFTNPATGLTEVGSSILSGGPLSLSQPGIFGEFTNTAPPRVLQLSLRYSF
jgi:hypothetical protein